MSLSTDYLAAKQKSQGLFNKACEAHPMLVTLAVLVGTVTVLITATRFLVSLL